MESINDGAKHQKSVQDRIDEIMNKHRDQIKSLKSNITLDRDKPVDSVKTINNKLSAYSNGYHHNTDIDTTPVKVLNKEILLDFGKTSMSKTDVKGVIEYANEDFIAVCGYQESELMGQPHNIVRHPDMPRLIFKFIWQRLHKGKGLYAIVKNLSKDGRYYWIIARLTVKKDDNGNIISYFARRKAAPRSVIYKMEKLYKTLRSIEQNRSLEVAQRYFYGMLEDKNLSYDELILSILGVNEEELASYFTKENSGLKKSFFQRIFK